MEWKKVDLSRLCDYHDENGERCASAAQPQQMTLIGYPAMVACKSHRRELTRIWDDARDNRVVR